MRQNILPLNTTSCPLISQGRLQKPNIAQLVSWQVFIFTQKYYLFPEFQHAIYYNYLFFSGVPCIHGSCLEHQSVQWTTEASNYTQI